jgi:hypothetical protein
MILKQKNSTVKNNIFVGSYSFIHAPIDPELKVFWENFGVEPSGMTGAYVKYNTTNKKEEKGFYSTGVFPNEVVLSGALDGESSNTTNGSGYLYFRNFNSIYGVCHGFGRDSGTFIDGYNFYNAFSPEGYISPFFSQIFSLYKIDELKKEEALISNGACSPLTSKEYNDIFGIVSEFSKGAENSITVDQGDVPLNLLNPFINSPALMCPQDLSVAYYYTEKQKKIIAGTKKAIAANSHFNSNPIPSVFDTVSINVKNRYEFETGESRTENVDGRKITLTDNYIKFDSSGAPIPSYLSKVKYGTNPFLQNICQYANWPYFGVVGPPFKSFLLDVADELGNVQKGLFDSNNQYHLWTFLFKENTDGFPFLNDYKSYSTEGGDYNGLAKTPSSSNYGSKLFKPELSDPDHYWEHRQCPGVIDVNPHNFGASIYACPSKYFDVPYYAAIKKFGFYGTRFFNGCIGIDKSFLNKRDNNEASEVPPGGDVYTTPIEKEPDYDEANRSSYEDYDNLLKIANLEERHLDFYFLNKMFFLQINFAANDESKIALSLPEYVILNNFFKKEPKEVNFQKASLAKFIEWYSSDLWWNELYPRPHQFLNFIRYSNYPINPYTGDNTYVKKTPTDTSFVTGFTVAIYNQKTNKFEPNESDGGFLGFISYDTFTSKDTYQEFYEVLKTSFTGADFDTEIAPIWKELEEKLTKEVVLIGEPPPTIRRNDKFYSSLDIYKKKLLQYRFLENYVQGNPIDLYPSNKITFGFDSSADYLSWSFISQRFGYHDWFEKSNDIVYSGYNFQYLPKRRYFQGAYSVPIDEIQLSKLLTGSGSNAYAGYANNFPAESFRNEEYVPIVIGNNFSNQYVDKKTIFNQQNLLPPGWQALGAGGITKLRGTDSCFTPIFIQQPMYKTHCKIGQAPTFRCLAVDYHTIPEDKINDRYPEIKYWLDKLKVVNRKYKNLYPLNYKWFRIKKSDCNYNFNNFITSGYFSDKLSTGIDVSMRFEKGGFPLESSDPSGDWCCLEGDGPNCTLIHPKECVPAFSPKPSFSYKYEGTPGFEESKRNNFDMHFVKGATSGKDENYYYFCMVKGRFGTRISEPSELYIDNNLFFDINVLNGGPWSSSCNLSLETRIGTIDLGSIYIQGNDGLHQDESVIPEAVIEETIPPPNKGWGSVRKYKFVGPWGYRGYYFTYAPGTLNDTRGLKQTWGRILDRGNLHRVRKKLTQEEGDIIYGSNHLPECYEGKLVNDYTYGISLKINGSVGAPLSQSTDVGICHWANMQKATITSDFSKGVNWRELRNEGEFYSAATFDNKGKIKLVGVGVGTHWEWGNNLGTIHRFGYLSKKRDRHLIIDDSQRDQLNFKETDFQKLKDKLLKKSLDGKDCGWTQNGFGRDMLYWVEGYKSFYSYCDSIKKKNVLNRNYTHPGLRYSNSSIQYFWLGKPSNTYFKRYPMYGPYAYQWKVMPHNRDRNGNGMSEGFHSYAWGTKYSYMYDAPAVYGLKYRTSIPYPSGYLTGVNIINSYRAIILSPDEGESPTALTQQAVKYLTWGIKDSPTAPAQRYGSVWVGALDEVAQNPNFFEDNLGWLRSDLIVDYVGAYRSNKDLNLTKAYIKNSINFSTNYAGEYDYYEYEPLFNYLFYRCRHIFPKKGLISSFQINKVNEDGTLKNIVDDSLGSIPASTDYRRLESGKFASHFVFPTTYPPINVFNVKNNIIFPTDISPCDDGHGDLCNYITPTINLGTSSFLASLDGDDRKIFEYLNQASELPVIITGVGGEGTTGITVKVFEQEKENKNIQNLGGLGSRFLDLIEALHGL